MNSGLLWTVIGSVSGVIAVLAGVIFGILQVRQGKKGTERPGSRVSQSVQAGRDSYTAGGDQYIAQDRHPDQ